MRYGGKRRVEIEGNLNCGGKTRAEREGREKEEERQRSNFTTVAGVGQRRPAI